MKQFGDIYQLMAQKVFLFLLILFGGCTSKQERGHFEVTEAHKDSLFQKIIQIRNTDTLLGWSQRYIQSGDKIGELFCYREMGRIQRENSQLTEAINNHQKALDIALILKDTTEIVKLLNDLGVDLRRIGALPEASSYHYKALGYAEAYSGKKNKIDAKNLVIATNGIANISLLLGYDAEAEKYYRKSLQGEKELGSEVGQAINLAKLGTIFEQRQQYDSAQVYYQRSMEQNVLAKTNRGIGLCLIHLGGLHQKQKQYELALEKYHQAFELLKNESNKWDWIKSCVSIAEISLTLGDTKNFNHYIDLAEKKAEEINSLESQIKIHSLKHDYNVKQANYVAALNHYKASQLLKDSIQGIEKNNRYTDLRMNYQRDQNERRLQQIEAESNLNEVKRQRTIYFILSVLFLSLIFIGMLYYAYRQRVRSNRMLKEIEKNRSDFFTNITHEFRTPLTVIQGLNRQMQQNKNLTEKERNVFMAAIDRQSNNLLHLVNQLLDFARLRAGIDSPQWRHGNIIPYLQMIFETFRLYAKEKEIDLVFTSELKEQNMDFIPSYMDKIVGNLLSNAIKHSSKNSEIRFIVMQSKNPNALVIKVSDMGEGIAQEDLKHIFELFYQGKTQKTSGTGIGLSFTQMMVKKMNGNIEVKSQLGQGAEFSVTLPIKNKNLSNVLPIDVENEMDKSLLVINNSADCEQDTQQSVSAKPIVLLVEDNPDVLMYVKSLISKDYQVITAENGEEGLEKAQKYVPDLVITDVMMPKMDGYQLCQAMKQSQLLNHIPIIMLTAKSTDEDRLEGLRYGVEAYLRKPFQAEELLIRIAKILENRELLKQKYMNAVIQNTTQEKPYANDDNLKFLQHINSIIYSNPKDVTVSFLAEKTLMSISQLSRKLSGITGCSTVSYIGKVRLTKAKRMLQNSNMSMAEIADACGFENANYFTRLFKKEFGMTPSQFQKMI
ncbi:hybrid sensor histidine kinase/response regulator transcription factor [Capnocytophaga canimorsus]|uniref:hybrid sensor histidine kinase/response regulator transcription factor n=1 Tax=Capnocytophaga canimorsus TaxID=28188 RepID=UPI000F71BAA8|nr:response regulator [Capnocytophaga canimorsus]VEJ19279.1 Sensor protein evgS precursor [Capnocytophaga canimorsus]